MSRKAIVFDLIKDAEPGTVIKYTVLGKALNLHPVDDRHAIRMAVRPAMQQLEEEQHRTVEAVPDEGYRVVPGRRDLPSDQQRQSALTAAADRGWLTYHYSEGAGKRRRYVVTTGGRARKLADQQVLPYVLGLADAHHDIPLIEQLESWTFR